MTLELATVGTDTTLEALRSEVRGFIAQAVSSGSALARYDCACRRQMLSETGALRIKGPISLVSRACASAR